MATCSLTVITDIGNLYLNKITTVRSYERTGLDP